MTSFTIQVIINNHALTSDFLHGTHHTTLVQLIRTFYDENTHAVANFYNYFGDVTRSSNLHWLWKLAVPLWETGSTTTAHGNADGLLTYLFRVVVRTLMITTYTVRMNMQ